MSNKIEELIKEIEEDWKGCQMDEYSRGYIDGLKRANQTPEPRYNENGEELSENIYNHIKWTISRLRYFREYHPNDRGNINELIFSINEMFENRHQQTPKPRFNKNLEEVEQLRKERDHFKKLNKLIKIAKPSNWTKEAELRTVRKERDELKEIVGLWETYYIRTNGEHPDTIQFQAEKKRVEELREGIKSVLKISFTHNNASRIQNKLESLLNQNL